MLTHNLVSCGLSAALEQCIHLVSGHLPVIRAIDHHNGAQGAGAYTVYRFQGKFKIGRRPAGLYIQDALDFVA
jgi:hypothetical protein